MPFRRLDAFLASRNFGSRKDVLSLIKAGAVLVNGVRVLKGGQKIDLERDQVIVRGKSVSTREHLYVMLHKPKGVISAARDPNAVTVLDLLPEELRRRGLFPAGRLDKDTTGLLFITDDGVLAHDLLSPRHHVEKVYRCSLREPVREEDVAAFASGLHLPAEEGHPPEECFPARMELLSGAQALVALHEGKYHQVKRMFRAVGNEVLELHRERFGTLSLDDTLQAGECRELTEAEIAALNCLRKIR